MSCSGSYTALNLFFNKYLSSFTIIPAKAGSSLRFDFLLLSFVLISNILLVIISKQNYYNTLLIMLYINAYKNNSFNLYLQVNNNIFTKKKFGVPGVVKKLIRNLN
jgi:hypothetical protein